MTDDSQTATAEQPRAGGMRLAGRLAKREGSPGKRCAIDRALTILGTRSAILLMREAFYGTTRFDDFVEHVGVTEAVAATRLRELERAGLMARRAYREPGRRTRNEYVLTQAGAELLPLLLAFMQWGDRYVPLPDGPALALRHEDCGRPVSVEVRCSAGHQVGIDEIAVTPLHD